MTSRGDRRPLGRRELIGALTVGGFGLRALARAAGTVWASPGSAASMRAATCFPSPEQTAGPFHVANELLRRDVTENRAGLPLRIRLTIRGTGDCKPIRGADVEIWHCDADGVYSGVLGPDDATTFLRGHQVTNRRGSVRFETIYPGWYPGRTPHVHVRVEVDGVLVHTGQLYFDDAITSAVYRREPYASRGEPDTDNANDAIYALGGAESTLRLRKRRRRVKARLALAVDG